MEKHKYKVEVTIYKSTGNVVVTIEADTEKSLHTALGEMISTGLTFKKVQVKEIKGVKLW